MQHVLLACFCVSLAACTVTRVIQRDARGLISHRHRLQLPKTRDEVADTLQRRFSTCSSPALSPSVDQPGAFELSCSSSRPRVLVGLYLGSTSTRQFHDEWHFVAASRLFAQTFAAVGVSGLLLESKARCQGYQRHLQQFDFLVLGHGVTIREWQLCEAGRAGRAGVPVFLFGARAKAQGRGKLARHLPLLRGAHGCVGDRSTADWGGFHMCDQPFRHHAELQRWRSQDTDPTVAGIIGVVPAGTKVIVVLVGEALASEASQKHLVHNLVPLVQSETHTVILTPLQPFHDRASAANMTQSLVDAGGKASHCIGLGKSLAARVLSLLLVHAAFVIDGSPKYQPGQSLSPDGVKLITLCDKSGTYPGGCCPVDTLAKCLKSGVLLEVRESQDSFGEAASKLVDLLVPLKYPPLRKILRYKNLGDELVYDACARVASNVAAELGVGMVMENLKPLCNTYDRGGWLLCCVPEVLLGDWSDWDAVMLAGGSLLRPFELCQLRWAMQHKKPVIACGTGYEDLDQPLALPSIERLLGGGEGMRIDQVLTKQATTSKIFNTVPEIKYGGWRGNITRAVAKLAGGAGLASIGDPGLLYGSHALFGQLRQGAFKEATRVLESTGLNREIPFVMVM